MEPCTAGPDVMRPLTDLDEARALIADLLLRGTVELSAPFAWGMPLVQASLTPKVYGRPVNSGGPDMVSRRGETLDEALRALHRATVHLRAVPQ